jgi:hypothetical protein
MVTLSDLSTTVEMTKQLDRGSRDDTYKKPHLGFWNYIYNTFMTAL